MHIKLMSAITDLYYTVCTHVHVIVLNLYIVDHECLQKKTKVQFLISYQVAFCIRKKDDERMDGTCVVDHLKKTI